jgi:hypothetical protein
VPDLRSQQAVTDGDSLQVITFDSSFWPGLHDFLREGAERSAFVGVCF